MDANGLRSNIEFWVFNYDEVNTPSPKSTHTREFQKKFNIMFLEWVAQIEIVYELKGTPVEQDFADIIAQAKDGDVALSSKVRNELERVLKYMAAEGIPRRTGLPLRAKSTQ